MQDLHASKVDLNLLVALDALLTERNVTRAAERVGLTQSAMSHKLRRLRDLFADELLVNGRGGMVPTTRAEELIAPVRRGLLELNAAMRTSGSFSPATAQRSFAIVSSDYADFVILPHVLQYMSQKAPGIDIVMRPATVGNLPAQLERGTVDLIMGQPVEGTGLMKKVVYEEGFFVIARKGHPRIDGQLDMEKFVQERHVLVSPDGDEGIVDGELRRCGLQRRIALRTPYFVGAPFIVARTDLIMTAPSSLALEAARHLALQLLPSPLNIPAVKVTMTWHERANRDPAHRWLRETSARITHDAMHEYHAS